MRARVPRPQHVSDLVSSARLSYLKFKTLSFGLGSGSVGADLCLDDCRVFSRMIETVRPRSASDFSRPCQHAEALAKETMPRWTVLSRRTSFCSTAPTKFEP